MAVPAGFAESVFVSGVTRATAMAFAPDGRLFVSQKDGNLRVVKGGNLLTTPFVKLPVHNVGERGLFGVAFDPNFTANKYVYVFYTRSDGSGGYVNRVSRFTANGDVAVAGSEKVLIEGDSLGTNTGHNGGALHFGKDGKLYITTGDNQNSSAPAQKNNLFGKMLRINPDGSIPADNPFYNTNTGKYRAVWGYGLRNPYSFAVQPGTGRIFINDVGQNSYEEINQGRAGANYGYPATEGYTTNPAYDSPFYAYPQFEVAASITGGAFYNPPNPSFPADYAGDYFFGDYTRNYIKRIDTTTKQVSDFVTNAPLVIDVDIAADGSLYYLSRADEGRVYRVRSTTSAAPTIRVQPQDVTVPVGNPATFTVEAAGSGLTYQWQRNGVNITGATGASYTIASTALADDGDAFRVVVSNSAGRVTSSAATLTVINDRAPTATITLPTAGTLWTAGGQLNFAGTGTDAEDGDLPASAFTWEVVFHHDAHTHPFVSPYSGVTSDSVAIPDTGETDPDVWYRVHLTVRDSAGLTSHTYRDVYPQKVDLSLATEPAGLQVTLDGRPLTAPFSTEAVVGLKRTVGAPATQTLDGVTYEFVGWADSASNARTITTPSADVTYTAKFKAVPAGDVVTLRAAEDAFVRDGTFASSNSGASSQLQVKTSGTSYTRHSYLKFDLATLPADIGSAKLRFSGRLDNTLAASVPVSVYAGPDAWSESTITWNNKPASGTGALASFTVSGTATKSYDVDLTSYLKQKKAAGARFATVVLKAASSQATVILASDEAPDAAARPTLTVRAAEDPGPTPWLLRPDAAAHVRNGSFASTNYGAAGLLEVKRSDALGYAREAYLRFDIGPLTTTASSAKLRLYGRLTEAASVQTAVHAATSSTWSESGITWNARPAAGTTALATASVSGTTNRWYEWDLTAFIQAEQAAGRSAVTLVLKNLQQTAATLQLASDEAATNGPELVVVP